MYISELTCSKGRPLAKPYANAIMSMLPLTKSADELKDKKAEIGDNGKERKPGYQPHEFINDLPIHPLTGPQIFQPTSESRVFTRADAAKVFDEHLLPADDRVPHPELALMHRDFKAGMTKEEVENAQATRDEEADKLKQLRAEKRAKRQGVVKAVSTPRWDFKFTEVNVDAAGKDGRGRDAVGWRYGFPHMDRSRAQHKIPRRAVG
jgi:hypothetical protein